MTRDEVRDQLSAYLDGELGEAEWRAVEAALEADAEFRAELDGLRRTIGLVRSLPRMAAPAGFGGRVQAAIGRGEEAARPSRRWLRGWRPAALAAAACLLLAFAALIASQPRQPRENARYIERTVGERQPAPTESPAKPDAPAAPAADGRLAVRKVAPAPGTAAEGEAMDKPEFAANAIESVRARHEGGGRGAAPAATAPAAPAPREPQEELVRQQGDALREQLFKKMEEKRQVLADAERHDADRTGAGQAGEPKAPTRTALGKAFAGAGRVALLKEAKAGETAKDEAAGPPFAHRRRASEAEAAEQGMRANRRALERDELLAAIEQKPAPAPPPRPAIAAKPAPEPPRRTVGAPATMAAGAAAELKLEVPVPYDNLQVCLARVQAALAEADASYVLQPVGGGEFVVETRLPEAKARGLVASLAAPAKDKELAKGKAIASGVFLEARKLEATAKGYAAAQVTVRLVLRFAPVAASYPAAGPAKPAEPAAREK